MSVELSYVLITPYSIKKSRTGGIISRLLSRSGLDLVAGSMFAPSRELVEAYAGSVVTETDERHRKTQELIRAYVLKNFVPDAAGRRQRILMLVLKGGDAVRKVLSVVGHIVHERTMGETIRDTYGDYIADESGVVYFEPAVLVPPSLAAAEYGLRVWAQYADTNAGLLDNAIQYPAGVPIERTLVLIKPDNFRFPSARPGGVIDVFSRSGLSIIAFKVHHMSVAQAEEFYRPVLDVLQDKLREPSGTRARLVVEQELGVPLSAEIATQLGEILGPICGRNHWESIVQFMAGTRPSDCPPSQRDIPGTAKCVALVYEGVDAVQKIRALLGPTDPSMAPSGTIRKEFGQTVMINAAHASDSVDSAQFEFKIVRIAENNLKAVIESHFAAAYPSPI